MISAGNDIVSLTATNVTRTKSPEFYSKIISPAERALFETLDHNALPFEHFVWLLWSVKESAYKYLHRLDPGIIFTPVKFELQSIEIPAGYELTGFGRDELTLRGFDGLPAFNGVVLYNGTLLYSKTLVYCDFVTSVVNTSNDFGDIYWGIRRVKDTTYKHQSAAVRAFALEALEGILAYTTVRIEKNEHDAPVVFGDDAQVEAAVSLSLSHHGEWVGYAVRAHAAVREEEKSVAI